jgi:NAD(P)-dependent dehydrogenase (short-subunit alcohol dehydrogenase family)
MPDPMAVPDLFSLSGRVVLVTGAGSGLGRAIAIGAAGAGARVVAADVNQLTAEATMNDIVAAGGEATVASVDVTDEASVVSMIETTLESFARLDVAFCNAGISGWYERIDELDLMHWRRVLDVNLTGTMLCAKHAARVMIPQGSGKLVLTASIWGLVGGGFVPIADYAASKGAVINLARELALELAPHGITVNALAPGFFDTNLGRDKQVDPSIKQRLREGSLELIPTHRRASPEEIIGTAVYLASAASDPVSGQAIVVDSGYLAR